MRREMLGILFGDLLKGKIIAYVFASLICIYHFQKYFSICKKLLFIFWAIAFETLYVYVVKNVHRQIPKDYVFNLTDIL